MSDIAFDSNMELYNYTIWGNGSARRPEIIWGKHLKQISDRLENNWDLALNDLTRISGGTRMRLEHSI